MADDQALLNRVRVRDDVLVRVEARPNHLTLLRSAEPSPNTRERERERVTERTEEHAVDEDVAVLGRPACLKRRRGPPGDGATSPRASSWPRGPGCKCHQAKSKRRPSKRRRARARRARRWRGARAQTPSSGLERVGSRGGALPRVIQGGMSEMWVICAFQRPSEQPSTAPALMKIHSRPGRREAGAPPSQRSRTCCSIALWRSSNVEIDESPAVDAVDIRCGERRSLCKTEENAES
jgi:hypothetical protein